MQCLPRCRVQCGLTFWLQLSCSCWLFSLLCLQHVERIRTVDCNLTRFSSGDRATIDDIFSFGILQNIIDICKLCEEIRFKDMKKTNHGSHRRWNSEISSRNQTRKYIRRRQTQHNISGDRSPNLNSPLYTSTSWLKPLNASRSDEMVIRLWSNRMRR
jgi:hypothetical protein